ncbi:MAG TPA: ATPase, T2SS/T4P/T4SS family [Acidimicrobiia bacterium]
MSDGTHLGSLLLQQGLITEAQLDAAVDEEEASGRPLGRVLIEMGHISEVDLVQALASQVGLEFLDLSDVTIDPSVAALLPEAKARQYQALPVMWREDGRLIVAMADPGNLPAVDAISTITNSDVVTVVSTASQLQDEIDRFHRLDGEVGEMAQEAADEYGDSDELSNVSEVIEDAPIVKFVNLVITQAVQDRASDIHVEPAEKDLRIRYRIDGVLHEVMHSPKAIQAGVISRLKVMSDINIAERRVPQDGRMSLKISGKPIDLRVATLPTVFGEKVVMRILDKGQALLTLDDQGFLPDVLQRYEVSFRKPYGTILVTGPTGSGKSTTLYATLNILNQVDRNIITVEDPVEYRLPGINQVQIHSKAGLSFAAALRSILRADPDIVLVGEIRDQETAIIAVEASLTGHLVLSTLHTNDAASTPLRLVEMGVEPFLVTSALDCVLAQRLARKLCDHCKEAYEPSEAELVEAGWPMDEVDELPTIYKAIGCSSCGKTGYRGRFALHEVMPITEEIERLIIERRATDDVKKEALMGGMIPLHRDGLRKVASGMTSLEEVFRVVA